MKKLFIIIIMFIPLISIFSGDFKKIVILDFIEKNKIYIDETYEEKGHMYTKPMNVLAAEQFKTDIVNFGEFDVVDQEIVDEAYELLGIKKDAEIDETTAIKIAKLSGADFLGYGIAIKARFNYSIQIKLIELTTGKYIYSQSTSKKLKQQILDEITNFVSYISAIEFNIEKFQRDQTKVVILDFETINANKRLIKIAPQLLTASLIANKKYWVINDNDLEKVLKELKLSNTSSIDNETAIKLCKKAKAKFVITGSIKQENGKLILNIKAIDGEAEIIAIDQKIIANSYDEIPEIINDTAKQITEKKDMDINNNEIVDINHEKYLEHRRSGLNRFIPGISLTSVGVSSIIASSILFGVYAYRYNQLQYMNDSPGKTSYSDTSNVILISGIPTLCVGLSVIIPGLALTCLSIKFFKEAKKFKNRSIQASYLPIIDISMKDITLGFSFIL